MEPEALLPALAGAAAIIPMVTGKRAAAKLRKKLKAKGDKLKKREKDINAFVATLEASLADGTLSGPELQRLLRLGRQITD